MPPLGRLTRLAPTRQPLIRSAGVAAHTQSRLLTTSLSRRAAAHSDEHHGHDAHESHYDAPGGWLWGQRPGEKYEKEGWENLFYWGFCGSWVVAIIAYAMKEDTSIQTWALEEARRRLEKEGFLDDSKP